jgi:Putative neutral zinc metallopeptidase
MFEDPFFWILVTPGLLLGVYAQWRIKINFAKYSQVGTQDGITGAEVARRLLNSQGLQKVAVESTPGILKDHYDPRSKTLRLSQEVYFTPSVAAAGIAAHETGARIARCGALPSLGGANLHRASSATSFADCPLAFCRRNIAAASNTNLGRDHTLWVVFPLCLPHVAGRIQCQYEGATIIVEPGHYSGR